jgi:hypothetical protein
VWRYNCKPEDFPPDQVIAINQTAILANMNGWHEAQLFNFAKGYLLANAMLQDFYKYMLNMPNFFAQIWADTFHHVRDYLAINSLMPEFYSYLLTISTIDPS